MSLRHTTAALFLGLSIVLSSAPRLIYAAEITLDVEVGYHGVFQLGRPFPIKIEVSNHGPPVEGTVEATVWKGGGTKGSSAFPIYHRRTLLVGAAARKSASFTIDPGSVSRPLIVSFHGPRETVTEEVDLRRHFVPAPLVLLITESDFSLLPGLSRAANPFVAVSPEELPSDPGAYAGVATVMLYEPSLRELSGAQAGALETWLAAGGRIVALGSMRYALYHEPLISRLLPVKVSGVKTLASLPELEKRYGALPAGGFPAQAAALTDGKSLIEEHGTPILVGADRGRGKILYLALDVGRPPLSGWEGVGRLLQDLAAAPVETAAAAPAAWDDAVFSQLLYNRAVASIYLPVGAFAGCIVAYLVGLGLLTWLWDRRRLVPRSLGAAFLTLVVSASFGGYWYFIRSGRIPDGVLVTSTVLESLADGEVEASSNAALFSTLRRDYDVVVEKGWTDFEPLARRSAPAEENSIIIEEEGSRPRLRLPLKAWDYRLFRLRSVARLPIRVQLDTEPNRRLLRVVNGSAQNLTDCWVVISGQASAIGDIPAGASRERELPLTMTDAAAIAGRAPRAAPRDIHFSDPIRELLLRYSYFPQEQNTAWSGAIFFGWVQAAPRGVSVADEKILTRDYAFFRTALPLGEDEE
jgi:hypothetical protein